MAICNGEFDVAQRLLEREAELGRDADPGVLALRVKLALCLRDFALAREYMEQLEAATPTPPRYGLAFTSADLAELERLANWQADLESVG